MTLIVIFISIWLLITLINFRTARYITRRAIQKSKDSFSFSNSLKNHSSEKIHDIISGKIHNIISERKQIDTNVYSLRKNYHPKYIQPVNTFFIKSFVEG